jgi:4,5-dihydroxyphthalate decarboxylase
MTLETLGEDVDLPDLLAEGKIDALIHPDVVPSKLLARKNVRRLFPRPAEEERKFYRRAGIIPVMNVVAFRAEELSRRPEVVKSVFAAFCRAKEIGLDAIQDNRRSGLLWYWESLEDQLDLVGADPAPYSLEKMRPTLSAFVDYAVEQGLLKTRMPLDDLFIDPKTERG